MSVKQAGEKPRLKINMSLKRPENDPLRETLQSWRVDMPLPPGFARSVWQRIDRSKPSLRKTVLAAVANWIANILPRPALAASYVAILFVFGVSAGWGHARQDSARLKAELRERYVQVLDPYLASH